MLLQRNRGNRAITLTQEGRVFYEFALQRQEITRKMYPFNDWKAGNYVKVDTSCISHVDILDVADKVDKAISSGVVCIDEMRKRLDMQELGTDFGKKHFVTKNYSSTEDELSKNDKNNEANTANNNDNTAKGVNTDEK